MAKAIRKAAFAATIVSVLATTPHRTDAQENSSSQDEPELEVMITGSRIKRESGFDYPVPVAVIQGEDIRQSGFTILGEAITNLPQALTNYGVQSTSSTLFNSGQSRVDLRGLGSARTLVLVDGRRHLTGDFRTSAVDLNMIPSTMIERVEAISGGASAVYGSEAISGVVNIILRKDFEGTEFEFQGGMTPEDDGEEWKAAFGYGTSFMDGRLHFLAGAEYGKVEPIYRVDRDWAFPGTRRDTGTSPERVIPASRSTTMPTATFQLIGSGNPASAQRSVSIALDRSAVIENSPECRTVTVAPTCQDEHLFYTASFDALQGGLDRLTARSYVGFELTDNANLFADVSYARVDGTGIFQPSFSNAAGGGTMPVSLRGDNAYLNGPSPLAAQLRDFWQAAGLAFDADSRAQVGKFWVEFGNRNSRVFRENYRAILGVEGGFDLFGRDMSYEVYTQYSELDGYTIGYNVPNISRVQAATDAVLLDGNIVCRSAEARAQGCVPWDLINGPSAEAVEWANAHARADGLASQSIVAADFSTSLIDLPAGPLGLAFGIEYRKEKSDQIQDELSASGALFYNAIGRTKGEYDLTEAYAEIAIPLLRDKPFAHRLMIEAAGRIGDYSTVGSVDQWRIAGEWAPVEDLRFRASTAVAVRAPNITELFAPQGQNFTTAANDPCDRAQIATIANDPDRLARRIANCSAAIPGYDPASFVSNFGTGRPSLALLQGGNTELTEETADTYSVGLVAQPRWVPNLLFSADYWSVTVEDAVSTIPINTLLQNLCYDSATPLSANRFCDLIVRDPTGASTGGLVGGVTQVILTNQNVSRIETDGIDFSLSYSHDFGAPGLLQLSFNASKIIRWDLQGSPADPTTQYAGKLTGVNGAVPEYKMNAVLGWSYRNLGFAWTSRYYSTMGVSETLPMESRDPFFTGSYLEHDVRVSYKLSDALSLRVGAINVTDERPPAVPEAGAGTGLASSIYDNRGRFFYIGGNYFFQ